jgi:UDP-3-O-[3-hydroxymyristoyl] N-acetylglucosamine deacetylase
LHAEIFIFKIMQTTLTNTVIFQGVGLHSGEPVSMSVSPAAVNEGIRFIRKDMNDGKNIIMARYDNVVASQLCTLLKNEFGATVSTVEHVMAALAGLGIDNATLIVDGPEVPIMDGSSLPFVEKFLEIGLETQIAPRKALKILKSVEIHGERGAFAKFEPATQTIYDFTIDFENRFIGRQSMEFTLQDRIGFHRELADSPTFTTSDVIDHLRANGLIKGGSEDNADIYADDAIYRSKSRKRQPKAAVRHKLLDAVGDIALLGMPFIGKFACEKGGHALTNQLIRTLMAEAFNYQIVDGLSLDMIPSTQRSAPTHKHN